MSSQSKKNKRPKLTLNTGKHDFLEETHRCSNCGRTVSRVKYYYHSNRGPVYVCLTCDEPVRNRSFKKKSKKKYIDALDRAVHYGHFRSRGVRGRLS